MRNIVLIGFMGTGKTAIGRRLAGKLRREFMDTDAAIEELTGKSISEIFRRDGAIRFRSEEKLQVQRLADKSNMVISTGGGLVLDQENVTALRKNGVLICLTADPEVIYNRVKNKNNRPLLQKGSIKESVYRLMQEREENYNTAEFTVDTGKGSLSETVDKIMVYLRENNYI